MMIWYTKYILLVMLPGMLIGLWAQMKLMSTYAKYTKVPIATA